jgi:hypothetical protein
LDAEEIVQLVTRCAAWFEFHGLAAPKLYVPPAWALGELSLQGMQQLPFRMFESLAWLHFPIENWRRWLPLVGFEADTRFRKFALRVLNQMALHSACLSGRALRIAIHPYDQQLQLAQYMRRVLSLPMRVILYRDLL